MSRYEQKKSKAHNAPDGYYTASEAKELLGMGHAMFYRNVGSKGMQIRKYVPHGAKEGFYSKQEIDVLVALREHGLVEHSGLPPTIFRQATPADAQGVVDVLLSRGWKTTTAEQRIKWYAVNPEIDHIVLLGNIVIGYLSATPYRDEIMEKRLRGLLESSQIKPEDILPFQDGHEYSLFVGLAERKLPEENAEQFAKFGVRLVLGFRRFLMEDLYERGIHIKFLLAHSAEEPGQRLADALGFVLQEPSPEDKYPIYILDMEHSDEPWVKRYRELWEKKS